jgi:hypothetical protein
MKSRILPLISAMTLIAALESPPGLAAQAQMTKGPKYISLCGSRGHNGLTGGDPRKLEGGSSGKSSPATPAANALSSLLSWL